MAPRRPPETPQTQWVDVKDVDQVWGYQELERRESLTGWFEIEPTEDEQVLAASRLAHLPRRLRPSPDSLEFGCVDPDDALLARWVVGDSVTEYIVVSFPDPGPPPIEQTAGSTLWFQVDDRGRRTSIRCWREGKETFLPAWPPVDIPRGSQQKRGGGVPKSF